MQHIFQEYPHKRYNPLTDAWVLVSPHRAKRPWQGQVEKIANDERPSYDSTCYLCARNVRANGENNPDYKDVFVFDNDFAALLDVVLEEKIPNDELFRVEIERGLGRVLCFSPKHNLTVPEMEESEIRKVVDVWISEYETLGAKDFINYVQIFENKGAIMGCSNPHPHGQIWAQNTIPDEPQKKQNAQLAYFQKHKKTLLSDYLQAELAKNERILFENEHFVGLVPFWATWPFEAMILPKRPMSRITDMSEAEKDAFANAYKQLTVMYDNIFEPTEFDT